MLQYNPGRFGSVDGRTRGTCTATDPGQAHTGFRSLRTYTHSNGDRRERIDTVSFALGRTTLPCARDGSRIMVERMPEWSVPRTAVALAAALACTVSTSTAQSAANAQARERLATVTTTLRPRGGVPRAREVGAADVTRGAHTVAPVLAGMSRTTPARSVEESETRAAAPVVMSPVGNTGALVPSSMPFAVSIAWARYPDGAEAWRGGPAPLRLAGPSARAVIRNGFADEHRGDRGRNALRGGVVGVITGGLAGMWFALQLREDNTAGQALRQEQTWQITAAGAAAGALIGAGIGALIHH